MVLQVHPVIRPVETDNDEPGGIAERMNEFLDYMRMRGLSEFTLHRRCHVFRNFADWCAVRGVRHPRDITKPILERYQRHLYHFRSTNGKPLSFRTQYIYLSALQTFFHFLGKKNYILSNPAADLDLPRFGQRLPRGVLTLQEVEQVLNVIDVKTPLGIRNRAILETLYSTGIRRMELIRLQIFDLDIDRQTLMIREGKMKKDRILPIGERALAWLRKYLEEVRPGWVVEPDSGTLFLTMRGEFISPHFVTKIVKDYLAQAKIGKSGSCHMFRHTMATLMLEGGADIRYIQQMLGHAKLETTNIYTHVSIRKLQEIYMATHPGAKLERKTPDPKAFEKAEKQLATEKELFSSLAAEEKEEDEKPSGGARTGGPTGSAPKSLTRSKRGNSGDRPKLRRKG